MDDKHLPDRLRELGAHPVPPTTRTIHHRQMTAAATAVRPQKRFGRFAVAAAAIVGFMAGSTGLAMAGALPDPAQGVAHDVLSVVQVQVPDDPRNRGACVSAVATGPGTAEEKAQAKEQCPKGGAAVTGRGGRPEGVGNGAGKASPGVAKHANDPCRGRPPWAGNALPPAEREARQAEREACPPDQPEG